MGATLPEGAGTVEPFEVKLFYTKNEYLRFLDYLEGDDSIPDDLYDSLVDGIREQVTEHRMVDDHPIGTVAVTGSGATWTKVSHDIEKNWVSHIGAFARGEHVLDIAHYMREPA